MAVTNIEAIQKLYVAYFNRPADYEGLMYWDKVVTAAKGDTSAVSAAFAGSKEYKDTYAGMTNLQVVLAIYKNLFNESNPDMAGVDFWVNALSTKAMTIDNAVAQIAAGAQSTHKDTYAAKVSAASAFTAALDTPAEAGGYIGDAANAVAKTWMSTINKDTLAAAITPAALNSTIGTVVDNGPLAQGKTFTLTAAQDILTGTAGNDTFVVNSFKATDASVDMSNMSAVDSIDGGDGKDTLTIAVKSTGAGANYNGELASVKNVEIINLNLSAADTVAYGTVDASKFAGATNINQIGKAVNVTKLGATTTAGYDTVGAGAYTIGATGAAATISLNKVAEAATFAVSGSKLAGVTVSGNRADTNDDGALTALGLTVTAGTDVQTVTVTTDQKTTLTLAEAADSVKHITTVNASASTGAVTFVGNADAATISTGSGKDVVTIATTTSTTQNASLSTGAGDDTITVSTTGGAGTTTVDAGAGNDKITLNKVAGNVLNVVGGEGNDTVTIVGNVETTDVIDGGAGTDIVSVAGKATRVADDYIVFNKILKGFETIKFTGATAEGALDASLLAANYTTIDLNAGAVVTKVGTQALIANGNLTATAAGYDATDPAAVVYAGSLNITEKTNGGAVTAKAETVSLTVKAATAAGGNVTATLLGDVKTATVTTVNSVNATSDATADTIAKVVVDTGAVGGAAAMTGLTLTGNGSAQVTNAAGTKLVTVDASALGGTYTLGAGAGTPVTGLTYVSSNTKAETIKLGAGLDSVVLNASTYGKVDTVTGLKLVTNTAGTALTWNSDQLNVTGFNAATGAKFTTTQTDLDLALKDAAVSAKGDNLVFQMGGDTYVYVDTAGAGNGTVDATDIVVKLTGTVDLDALLLALGTPVV